MSAHELEARAEADLSPYDTVRGARVRVQRLAFGLSVAIPVLGLLAAPLASARVGFSWVEPVTLAVMWLISGLGIEAGYHRLFSHQSYQTTPWMRALLAIAGNMAVQGPLIYWVSHHRLHHGNADQPLDPHSPHSPPRGKVSGFVHAHVGWFFSDRRASLGRYARDLLRDRSILAINQLGLLWIALGLALPAAIGGLGTRTWAGAGIGFLWGGLARICLTQQFTYAVNSVCHVIGSHPYDSGDRAGNVWWMVIPTCGGGLHNNHHAFPRSATYNFRWWHLDPSGWFIRGLARLGLAWDLKRPAEEKIREASLMTAQQLETWLVEHLAQRLKLPVNEIDPARPLEEYGLDSLEAVALSGELEALLGRMLNPTILWDYPTVRALAAFLVTPR